MQNIAQTACEGAGGVFAGDGTDCNDDVCDPGACCQPLGSCSERLEVVCVSSNGLFQGPNTICDPNPCSQPLGACCTTTDFCFEDQLEADCDTISGTWAGPFTICFPGMCPIIDDGDADQDGDVDTKDAALLQICYEQVFNPTLCKPLDMNNDQEVTQEDYDLFAPALDASGPQ